jgi:hypothetical protein
VAAADDVEARLLAPGKQLDHGPGDNAEHGVDAGGAKLPGCNLAAVDLCHPALRGGFASAW